MIFRLKKKNGRNKIKYTSQLSINSNKVVTFHSCSQHICVNAYCDQVPFQSLEFQIWRGLEGWNTMHKNRFKARSDNKVLWYHKQKVNYFCPERLREVSQKRVHWSQAICETWWWWWVELVVKVRGLLLLLRRCRVCLFVTAWIKTCQPSLFFTLSLILLKLMSIKSGMPSNHLILCCLQHSIFPNMMGRVVVTISG